MEQTVTYLLDITVTYYFLGKGLTAWQKSLKKNFPVAAVLTARL